MTSRKNIKSIIVVIVALFYNYSAVGQNYEELDEAASDITKIIGMMKGDISSLFSVSDYFTSAAKDEYKKKLKSLTLLNFRKVPSKQYEWLRKNNYTVTKLNSDKLWDKQNSSWNRTMSSSDVTIRCIADFGSGATLRKFNEYKNEIETSIRNLSIENAFPPSVKDRILGGLVSNERVILDSDIKAMPILINFFSEYPDAIDIYRSFINSDFRTDLKLLYFFSYEFITDEIGIKKGEIIDPNNIKFDISQKGHIKIFNNGNLLATLSKFEMNIIDPMMLNYAYPPNYEVKYNGLIFQTDNLKRITSIKLPVGPKGEKISKSKSYDIKKFNKKSKSNYSFLISEKINGYKVLQNAFELDAKNNKKQMKYIENSYKRAQKNGNNNTMIFTFNYDAGEYEPSIVFVELTQPIKMEKQIFGQRTELR